MDPIQRSPRTKLVGAPAAAIFLVEFHLINMAPTRPLADKRVALQALNYAIDRTQINQSIMHNTGALIATFCPPAGVGCDASIPPFPYDPQRARDLLRDAGYPNGIDMTMGYTNGIYPEDHNIALAIVDQLGRVGVRVTPSVMDYGIPISQLASKKIPDDAFLSRSTAQNGYFEEVAAQALHTGGAASFWSNFDFDVLLDTAEVTTDETRRNDILRRAQLLVKDEAPIIPLFTAPNADGLDRDLIWTPRFDGLLTMVDASWNHPEASPGIVRRHHHASRRILYEAGDTRRTARRQAHAP